MPTLGKTKVSPSLISTGSLFEGTSSYAVTASYAMNGGSGGSGGAVQTGSIANQTVLYNVTTSQDNVITGLNLSNNKWGVSVVEEWNSIPGDLNISSCSLLMHFSGSNNSTTFIDSSPNNFVITASGNVKITSSISKFESRSGFFDGTGDNLLINYNTAFNLSGDFTIEVWFYPVSLNDSYILNFAGGLNIAWASYALYVNANGVHFVGSSTNSGYDIGSEGLGAGTIGALTLNTWSHIAVTRQGNVYRGFINGVQGYTQTLALTPYNPNARGLSIGGNYANTWGGTPVSSINGYLDELRITKGVARYTAGFVTQSIEFPNQLPQYETKYIGLVGGLNDTGSDYGVEKLSDSSLKIRKMSVSGTPVSGSPVLSASVDRVYVNVLNYDNVSISGSISNAISSSYSLTASYNLNSVSSSFANTSSYSLNSVSSSYALTASFALNSVGGGTTLTTGSTYPITSSWAATSSNIIGGTSNYIPLWSTNTSLGNSVLYQNSSNIGIGTTSPGTLLQVVGTGVGSVGTINIKGASAHLGLTNAAGTFKGWYGYYNSTTHGSDNDLNIKTGYAGTSNIRFSTDGDTTAAMLYIKSDGNVGIGTTSPGYKLDVVGAVRSTIDNSFSFASNRSAITVWSGLGFLTNNVNKWFVGLRETSDDNLRWYNFTNSSERMVLTETGNLGIGTTNPSAKLHVNGNISGSSFTGSVFGTSSWATNASTASYNLNSISSSFANTSSYNLNSVSSSYALTASFALNSAGGGGTTLTTGSTYPITSSWAINAITASYALNASGGGSGGSTQTGSIANQTILYNVTTSQDNVISGLNLSSNKWGVTVVEEWNSGSIVGDEYYSSCSLLMHFSGSNGSTTFIDNSPSPKTATSNNGASISTVQSKFGGTSGLFDGGDDYVTVPDNSEFDFGAGDFTIEYWEYRTSNAVFKPVMSRNSSGQPPWMIGWTEAGNINFFAGNGSSWSIASAVSMGVIIINSWTHYAVTRQGNTFRTFQNGTQISTFTSTATIPNGAAPLEIGRYAATYYYPGYLDELRLTKGVARYTGSFVTQSVEFPNNLNVTQLQTKYIGLVGGLNDSNVDYGVEKLSDSSLKIRKMTATGQPLSGSGSTLSASVDRVYVNVIDYTNVMVTSSYALTASYVLGGIQTGSISNQTILYNVTTSQENTITGLDLSGNKWDVSVIEEWNSGSGDIYYPSCSLLMHFSGSNGSTTFIDNSPNNFTITSNNDTAISTVQSKFGGASAFFDGTNDYLSTPNTVSNFGTDDFTIECWFYRVSTNSILISNATGADNNYFAINADASNAVIQIRDNSSQAFAYGPATTLNVWNHIAVTRNAGTVRVFVNGVSGTPVSITKSFTSRSTIIGGFLYTGFEGYFYGYIDELRITKGIARYTSSFATQSIEFSNQVPQYETKYIGLVGGLNDTNVDYGVEKLSDSSLKIRKMSVSGTPISGSPFLSASVDRVYVNVLNYKEVQTTAQSASYAVSSSYVINAPSGESFHPFLLG